MVDASSQVNPSHSPEEVWSHVVDRARSELSDTSMSMWFAGLRPVGEHDGAFEVVAPSGYVRDWLVRHHLRLIRDAVAEATGRQEIRVIVSTDEVAEPVAGAATSAATGTATV